MIFEFFSQAKGEYYQVTLSDAVISSFRASSSGVRPSETIALNFTKMEVKYAKADAQNVRGALRAVPAGWDVRQAVPDAK